MLALSEMGSPQTMSIAMIGSMLAPSVSIQSKYEYPIGSRRQKCKARTLKREDAKNAAASTERTNTSNRPVSIVTSVSHGAKPSRARWSVLVRRQESPWIANSDRRRTN